MCVLKRLFLFLCSLALLVLYALFVDSAWMDRFSSSLPESNSLQNQETFSEDEQIALSPVQPDKPVQPITEEEDDDNTDISAEASEERDETQNDGVDDEASDPALLAPRSYSGPYNEYRPGVRYLLYSPSGGFSNQRREVEYATIIAGLLDRVLYVPMCARHTNNWDHYAELEGESDLFPMDRIIDFPFLSNRLVPLNITVNRLVHRFQVELGDDSIHRVSNFKSLFEKKDVLKFKSVKEPLLFFRGKGFYHFWFTLENWLPTQLKMRFTKHLRDLAVSIASEAFGNKPFNAMHIRMGDYAWRRKDGDAGKYVHGAKDMKWNLKLPTYIATEPHRDAAFFGPIEQVFGSVLYSSDLPRHLIVKFTHAFPPGRIRGDMLGLLEQMICAQAKSFYGTYFSTFSKYIAFTRNHRGELFPETLHSVDVGSDK